MLTKDLKDYLMSQFQLELNTCLQKNYTIQNIMIYVNNLEYEQIISNANQVLLENSSKKDIDMSIMSYKSIICFELNKYLNPQETEPTNIEKCSLGISNGVSGVLNTIFHPIETCQTITTIADSPIKNATENLNNAYENPLEFFSDLSVKYAATCATTAVAFSCLDTVNAAPYVYGANLLICSAYNIFCSNTMQEYKNELIINHLKNCLDRTAYIENVQNNAFQNVQQVEPVEMEEQHHSLSNNILN